MAIIQHRAPFERLSAGRLSAWSRIQASVASDAMNRSGSMSADIKPIAPNLRLCGQARTVCGMVADSSIVHVAVKLIEPGDVLVMNVGGFRDCACWGGLATRTAIKRGAVGVVMDGSTRDLAEIRELGFPLFCKGAVPRGPHKGHGGSIDAPTAVGGVSVKPGDLVLGDDDGVVVIPLEMERETFEAAQAILSKEADWERLINEGGTIADALGVRPDRII